MTMANKKGKIKIPNRITSSLVGTTARKEG
jgi:hypothetical protein